MKKFVLGTLIVTFAVLGFSTAGSAASKGEVEVNQLPYQHAVIQQLPYQH